MPDLCMGLGSGCRAPNLQVLAMDLTRTPNLAEGLLASAGARLQHLQVVIEGPGYQMWPPSDPKLDQLWEGGFWSAVKAFRILLPCSFSFSQIASMVQPLASRCYQTNTLIAQLS